MTKIQQSLWEKAGHLAYRETAMINEGKFDDLFYRVALDYYTKLLTQHIEHVHNQSNRKHKIAQ